MKIKWNGETWTVKYYPTGYRRWTLENDKCSVSWLENKENKFANEKDFRKFLRRLENK